VVKPSSGRVLVASAPLPAARPGAPATGLKALAAALVPTAQAATPASVTVSRSPYAPHTILEQPLPRTGAKALLAGGSAGASAGGMPMPEPRPGTAAWSAEIGPYVSETAALATLADIAAQKITDASGFQVNQSGGSNGRPIYNLHLAGLSEGDAA